MKYYERPTKGGALRKAIVAGTLVAAVLAPALIVTPAVAHGKRCPTRYDLISSSGGYEAFDQNGNGQVCVLYRNRAIAGLVDDHVH